MNRKEEENKAMPASRPKATGKKIEAVACGKCMGMLIAQTDSKGYKKETPKCIG
jgi:hypothetical protein